MRRKFQLNKRDGKLMGVCAGLADYTGIDPLWIRIATVLAVLAGFGSLLLVYLIVGLAANDQPAGYDAFDHRPPLASRSEMDHWRGDVEHYYSASNPHLSRTIDGLR
jgi:phage shock protein C